MEHRSKGELTVHEFQAIQHSLGYHIAFDSNHAVSSPVALIAKKTCSMKNTWRPSNIMPTSL